MPIREGGRADSRPTWLDIDLAALAANYRSVHEYVAPRRVWCVVKADAYGHGAVEVSRRLQAAGADAFAVATVDEGVELRRAGVEGRVLVMAGIEPVESDEAAVAAGAAVEHRLEVAVWRRRAAERLGAAAAARGVEVPLHLKVDTGMGRLGVLACEALETAVGMFGGCDPIDGVRFEGVFSNLASADAVGGDPGQAHTAVQIERFGELCGGLAERSLLPPERHLGNSAAIAQHPASWRVDWCTGVRPGLALCGVPSPGEPPGLSLAPVMSWHSAVAAVRSLPAGWPLGYGARRRAAADCEIAVVPVGYHDGFPRALSDHAEVLVRGRRAKVVGAISMDLTLVDITGIPGVSTGDPVVLLGKSPGRGGDAITVDDLASWSGSIAHELLCRVGPRVPRRYVDEPR